MPRLFVDNLTVIDCSILDPERGLIGASWQVDIELQGELDEQSMVFDFAKVKKIIKQHIDQQVDHKLLVPWDFKGLQVIKEDNALSLEFTDQQQQLIRHRSPVDAVCKIPNIRVSRQAVTVFLKQILLPVLPNTISELNIRLSKESSPGHYYRYSHGLKKHNGNCQRIAHGHRSQIQIWRNGQRADGLEQALAKLWYDIYIGSIEDIVAQNEDRITFAYRTSQGSFILELPKNRVQVLDCDSTIECIAEHIRIKLTTELPHSEIKVKAFEGIGKGAVAVAN